MSKAKVLKKASRNFHYAPKVKTSEKIAAWCWSFVGLAAATGIVTGSVYLSAKPFDSRSVKFTSKFINQFRKQTLQQHIDFYKLSKSEFLDRDNQYGLYQYTKLMATAEKVSNSNGILDATIVEKFRPFIENEYKPQGTYIQISTIPDEFDFLWDPNEMIKPWVDYYINKEEGKLWIFLYKDTIADDKKLQFQPEKAPTKPNN